MSTLILREAARKAIDEWVDGGPEMAARLEALDDALDAPPPDVPDVPEVRRVIARVIDRHDRLIKSLTVQAQRINQQELERLIDELVSLWERS